MDDTTRENLWRAAVARFSETVPVIQLLQLTNTWAMRRTLTHEPRMDERTLAMGVRPGG
jgi:peptide/nickel transport system substrate-binding protein